MRRGRLLPALALALTTTVSGTLRAQTLPSFDARTWRPSTDPAAGLVLEPVATPGGGNWNVGVLFDYTHHPLTLRSATTNDVSYRPVELALGANLLASIGIGTRAALGLSLPTVLYQQGTQGMPPAIHTAGSVPTTALGDVGVHGKAAIVDNAGGGFGLAALANVTLPTGNRASFLGEGATTVTARLLAEYTLIIASAQASLGYTLRTEARTWPDASVGGIAFGDVLPWTFGLTLKPGILKLDRENRQRWDLAVHGWIPATPVGPFGAGRPGSSKETPVLLSVSDRIAIGHDRDVYALAGVDVGLSDAVGVPAFRAVIGIGWAPREHDQDHDGVPDDVDQCPDLPEDRDGFEDSDGCPDVDNDDDGVLDQEDACPNVRGVESPDPKANGCPAKEVAEPPTGPDRNGDHADSVGSCPNGEGCPHPGGGADERPCRLLSVSPGGALIVSLGGVEKNLEIAGIELPQPPPPAYFELLTRIRERQTPMRCRVVGGTEANRVRAEILYSAWQDKTGNVWLDLGSTLVDQGFARRVAPPEPPNPAPAKP